MNPNNRGSGLTVSKLRIFCSAVPNLPKGYSNAKKDDLLKMLSNRKKGKVFGVQFGNAIENKASTPIPLNKKRRKKPSALRKVGTCLRFVNAYFHQEMRVHVSKLKTRHDMKALDKRKKLPHHEVWEVIEGFYSNFPNEELDAMPTTMKRWDFFEGFQVDAESPEDFVEMTAEDLYLLHEFLLKKYIEAFRNNKTSGNHDDFQDYCGRDHLVSPGLYYYHLCLIESQDSCQKALATNTLPDGAMLQSLEDDSDVPSEDKTSKKRKGTPTEEFRKSLLASKDKFAQCFVEMSQQKKGDNDRKDLVELDERKLRRLEIEEKEVVKTQKVNQHFSFLLESNADLKGKLVSACDEEKGLLNTMLEANKKSMKRLLEEQDKES
jgi:hypothetical protein